MKKFSTNNFPKRINGVQVRFMRYVDASHIQVGIVGQSVESFEVSKHAGIRGHDCECTKTYNGGRQGVLKLPAALQ